MTITIAMTFNYAWVWAAPVFLSQIKDMFITLESINRLYVWVKHAAHTHFKNRLSCPYHGQQLHSWALFQATSQIFTVQKFLLNHLFICSPFVSIQFLLRKN